MPAERSFSLTKCALFFEIHCGRLINPIPYTSPTIHVSSKIENMQTPPTTLQNPASQTLRTVFHPRKAASALQPVASQTHPGTRTDVLQHRQQGIWSRQRRGPPWPAASQLSWAHEATCTPLFLNFLGRAPSFCRFRNGSYCVSLERNLALLNMHASFRRCFLSPSTPGFKTPKNSEQHLQTWIINIIWQHCKTTTYKLARTHCRLCWRDEFGSYISSLLPSSSVHCSSLVLLHFIPLA